VNYNLWVGEPRSSINLILGKQESDFVTAETKDAV
jgi:hypothetical protein